MVTDRNRVYYRCLGISICTITEWKSVSENTYSGATLSSKENMNSIVLIDDEQEIYSESVTPA
jgi:hypothetical protein